MVSPESFPPKGGPGIWGTLEPRGGGKDPRPERPSKPSLPRVSLPSKATAGPRKPPSPPEAFGPGVGNRQKPSDSQPQNIPGKGSSPGRGGKRIGQTRSPRPKHKEPVGILVVKVGLFRGAGKRLR